ncbi:MAG: hypothetical protein CO189_11825 [candidate division Zixibacteria bacterium CG_4_9_14_3_um_filter_46_8]|nr:MAG: hypothetical protein CO189_11825 [candidate division Zixibacteria bacterium CG_4_9_14_3_um_filter_46_8]
MDDPVRNYRKLQRMADYLCGKIENRSIDLETANRLESQIREMAAGYFPDKITLYEMIYASRFERLTEQYLRTD